jgi:hypothetical protein
VLAYDSRRGRSVLFGGVATYTVLGDTWEFDGVDWGQATVPSFLGIRQGHAMAFDAARGRCVLYGGFQSSAAGSGNQLVDLWGYDGAAWQLGQPGPGALAYDSLRERLYLFSIDTWFADAAGWHRVATAPPARGGVVFEAASGRFVVFSGTGNAAETWTFDGSNWVRQTPATSPPARTQFGLAYDAARARTVLFGGNDGMNDLADTWEFDGANWIQVATANAPSPRNQLAVAYDSRRGRTVLFGGSGSNLLGDTWEFDGTNWYPITTPTQPRARTGHALAFDVARGRVLLTGGFDSSVLSMGDAWEYDGTDWSAFGGVPGYSGRYGHSMVYDIASLRMVLGFGAWWRPIFDHGHYYDLWELPPPTTAQWTPHGSGCTGSAGTPVLEAVGGALPSLGTSFPLQIGTLPPGPGATYLGLGWSITHWQAAALPLELGWLGLPGCSLWIAPEPGLGPLLLHAGTSTTYSLALPNLPALAGLRFAAQALVFDSGAPNGVGAVSNAGVAIVH